MDNKSELARTLRQRRLMIPLTLQELGSASGVSASHLARIERGERIPSARILNKIAKPLGFGESELLALAGFLSPPSPGETEKPGGGRIDPYVAAVLSQEPVEVQRTVVTILSVIKSMAKGAN